MTSARTRTDAGTNADWDAHIIMDTDRLPGLKGDVYIYSHCFSGSDIERLSESQGIEAGNGKWECGRGQTTLSLTLTRST